MFTRGEGCRELAGLLGGPAAIPAGADLDASFVAARANLLVARKLTGFDLAATAVPHGLDPVAVTSVVAAVGGGPHSRLAARIAASLADALDVPARLVCVYPDPTERRLAEEALADAGADANGTHADAIQAANPADIVTDLPLGTLLVVGAPGGNWFQRHFFSAGHKLIARAPSGSIVVRDTARRVYLSMREPVWVGAEMSAADALRVTAEPAVPVVADGKVVGIAIHDMLAGAASGTKVAEVMIDPVTVDLRDKVDDVPAVPVLPEHAALPVVDGEGRLIGIVEPRRPHDA